MKILRLLIFMLLPTMAAGQQIEYDVAYRTGGSPYAENRCKMDIYTPVATRGELLPVVVWFHGGGLTGGSKSIPPELKNRGLIVAAVNYRLLSGMASGDLPAFEGSSLDETIDDAACAVSWIIHNIASRGGDTTRIVLAGHSAGGYLISLIGLDKSRLAAYGVDADKIAALVPFSGQTITHFAQRERLGIGPLQPVIDRYAPLYHIRKDCPPYIIVTGGRDIELFGRYEENAYMWRMMQLAGHPACRIYELDGFDHGAMGSPAFHILLEELKNLGIYDNDVAKP